MAEVVKVENGKVLVALGAFRLGIAQKQELLNILALGQLESIRRTFHEEGPGWPPLSETSRRWKKYTSGHKLLVGRGLLINSIRVLAESADSVVIGTNLRYAGVHQFGFDGTQNVSPYEYTRSNRFGNRWSKEKITNKLGRGQTVNRKTLSGVSYVKVNGFTRHIRIPARPFLVFRPEDPQRMQIEVQGWLANKAKAAGLEASGL